MPASLIPKPFDFHGDQLSTCKNEETGTLYCIPREITDNLGLAWQSQHAKLTKSLLYKGSMLRHDIMTQGQSRETLLLDVDMLPSWLMSISAEKVNPGIRDKLISYQRECAKALRDYWTTGVAVNPRATFERFPELRAIVELVEATAEARIAAEEAKAQAARAEAKADHLIQAQAWVTIHQYVTMTRLTRQMPLSKQQEFARYLTGYCVEHGYRMYPVPVAHEAWQDEKSYWIEAMQQTLPGWLQRHGSQTALSVVQGGA